MTGSHVRLPSSTTAEAEPRAGLLDGLNRAAPPAGHSLRSAVVPVAAAFRRPPAVAREVNWRHARAAELHTGEDRMRLLAALLLLGTLLLWILFLQA